MAMINNRDKFWEYLEKQYGYKDHSAKQLFEIRLLFTAFGHRLAVN